MNRRKFVLLLTGGMLAWSSSTFAQMSARRSLVAILIAGSSTNVSRDVVNGLLEGMQGLGYVEGRDIDFVYRYADNDLARMPALASELSQLMPAVFVASTIAGTLAIKQAGKPSAGNPPARFDAAGAGKRDYWWNCEPTTPSKESGWKPSTYRARASSRPYRSVTYVSGRSPSFY